ncbi:hypothetical protein [Halovivax gelatinilyticus]|uniref:hypothetical protein n=1 Tax=Halovivax gelatinilyticus TaxID=2961597 RepID=UPI0020CA556E|nr:hypothetical protein [Halovivax gelatinilyticus]
MPGPPSDDDSIPQGRLDPTALRTIGRRAASHPLVDSWRFQPTGTSPRYLEVTLVADAYPPAVSEARLDIRWFVTNDYAVHYIETSDESTYQCRWDRHPKTNAPLTHFHPPPDAGTAEPSGLKPHHLDVLFSVLDWIDDRVT